MKSVLIPSVLAEIADKAAAVYAHAMESPERSRTTTQDRWAAVVLAVRQELIDRAEVFDKPRRPRRKANIAKC